MVSIDKFRKLALSFPDALEEPHFERTSFQVKKKIFATMDAVPDGRQESQESQELVCLMLTPIDQSVFVVYDTEVMYPVPNKWGQKGATYVNLKKVEFGMLKDALTQAYETVKNKK